jgi:hypothetical protein
MKLNKEKEMTKANIEELQIDGKTYVPKDSIPTKVRALNGGEIEMSGNVFIRTVTFAYTGRVVEATAEYIAITDAAWIADTGRWTQAIGNGTLNEVEPYPDGLVVLVSKGAIVEISEWTHPLPRVQK